MTELLLSRRNLAFTLYEVLDVEELSAMPRFMAHDRATYDAVLDLYEQIAVDHFLPHASAADAAEPTFDGETVTVHPAIGPALAAFAASGLMAATRDEAEGGIALPHVVERSGVAYLMAANPATAGYPFLTIANINLLSAHADPAVAGRFLPAMLEGRVFGTMCLSEPQAGSSLGDIRTRAEAMEDGRYRLFGNKMWISGGEHPLAENIVHAVLAKIPDADGRLPAGTRGISLFVVPRSLADGTRNDVSLAGLNHKMGHRGTVNCALNFGEGRHLPEGSAGAIGEIVGKAGQGLAYMFHMMNEARIGVGLGAAAIGSAGYLHALDYARTRTQGRPVSQSNAVGDPVAIVEHPDVRRMLLAAKSYVEGGLALVLYAARLLDEAEQGTGEPAAAAATLLDFLTPIVKSWPSRWCLEANDLAIQVHGGYGYTRDYPVERMWRDNRLNPIHEGTYGIHAATVAKRSLSQEPGSGQALLGRAIVATLDAARAAGLHDEADALARLKAGVDGATRRMAALSDEAARLAYAAPYFDALGHLVVGWLWLWQAQVAARAQSDAHDEEAEFYRGKRAAAAYFVSWELPRAAAWLDVIGSDADVVATANAAWF